MNTCPAFIWEFDVPCLKYCKLAVTRPAVALREVQAEDGGDNSSQVAPNHAGLQDIYVRFLNRDTR